MWMNIQIIFYPPQLFFTFYSQRNKAWCYTDSVDKIRSRWSSTICHSSNPHLSSFQQIPSSYQIVIVILQNTWTTTFVTASVRCQRLSVCESSDQALQHRITRAFTVCTNGVVHCWLLKAWCITSEIIASKDCIILSLFQFSGHMLFQCPVTCAFSYSQKICLW